MFDPTCSANCDELHILLIAAGSSRAALLAVEATLAASDADLCQLTLKPVGKIVEATLKIRGLDAASAQRLAHRAGAFLGIHSARVEHLIEFK